MERNRENEERDNTKKVIEREKVSNRGIEMQRERRERQKVSY